MNSFESKTLALRALNYWRHRSHLSYFALRSLLLRSNDFDLDIILKSAEALLPRIGSLSFSDLAYKGTSEGKHSYRKITALSPHFAILEAFVLENLTTLPTTFHDEQVFSYRWPKSKNPSRFFEFYRQYYVERNELIQTAMQSYPNSVAVSMDVKAFYPSCSQKQCLQVLDGAVRGYDFGGLTMRFVEALLSTVNKGLPVGPAISHVIGNLIMKDIDCQLKKLPFLLYTRYVDDIVFVVMESDAEKTIESIQDILSHTDFECQEKKTDITTLSEWERHSPRYSSSSDSDSFEAIESRIQMYLLFKPHRSSALEDSLRNDSISLNVTWLQANLANSRWQGFIRSQRKARWLRDAWKATFLDDETSIVEKCIEVRQSMLKTYEKLLREPRPISKTSAKWKNRKIGYLSLRLTQLLPYESLGYLETSVGDCDLPSVTAILQDLQGKVIKRSLPFPGSTIDFLCTYWNSSKWESPSLHIENNPALYSALSIIIQMQATISDSLFDCRAENVAALLNWMIKQPGFPQAPLETFERELQCIISGENFNDTRATIQKTRFSDGESVDGSSFALEVISSLQSS
ncbi:MAG: RNA-directed DNA polymerase [Phormidesmis sp.]